MARDAEIKVVLDTQEAIQQAKSFGPKLEKALSINPSGNNFLETQQTLLKENLVDAKLLSEETGKLAKGLTTKGLEEYEAKFKDISKTVEDIENNKLNLATVQEQKASEQKLLNSLRGKIGHAEDKEKARAAYNDQKRVVEDLTAKEQELLAEQNQLNDTFDAQYKKIGNIADAMNNVKTASEENQEIVSRINTTYDELHQAVETTATDVETAASNSDTLEDKMSKTADAAEEVTSSVSDATEVLDEAASAADTLSYKMAEVKTEGATNKEEVVEEDTSEKVVVENVQKIDEKAEKAKEKLQQLTEAARQVNEQMEMDKGKVGIIELTRRLETLIQAQMALKKAQIPAGTEETYQNTIRNIEILKGKIAEYQKSFRGAEKSGTNFASKVSSAVSRLKRGMSAVGSILKTIKSGFSSLSKISNKVKSSFDGMARNMRSNFKHMLTNMTKYIFGFRSLFFLIRRLRKYLVEGIQNLVQFDSANNETNMVISELRTSLLYLKNAWAAAFAPIMNVIVPILTNLINILAEAGNALARFFGALTGQTVVLNAVRTSAGDYADSLGGVGDSAGGAADNVKKLTDRLAAFDDLNVLGKDNDDDTDGTGGGGGGASAFVPDPNDMFEYVDAVSEFADLIKEAWEKADFTEVGKVIKEKLMGILDGINWDDVQSFGVKLGKSFGTFLVGLFSDEMLYIKAAHAVAEGLNTITYTIEAFLNEVKVIDFGGNLAEAINTFFADIDLTTAFNNVVTAIKMFKDNVISFLMGLNWRGVMDSTGTYHGGIFGAFSEFGTMVGQALSETIGDAKFMSALANGLANFANAIVIAIQSTLDNTDGEDVGNALYEFFDTVLEELDWDALGDVISDGLILALKALTKLSDKLAEDDSLTEALKEFITGLKLDSVFEALGENISSSSIAAHSIGEALANIMSDDQVKSALTEGIKNLISNINVYDLVEAVGNFIGAVIVASLQGPELAFAIVEGLVNALSNGLAQALGEGLEYWDEAPGTEKTNFDNVGELIVHGILGAIGKALLENPIGKFVRENILDPLTDPATWEQVGKDFEEFGNNVRDGFLNGMSLDLSGGIGSIDTWLREHIFDPIGNGLKELFNWGSPSKVAEEWGTWVIQGFLNGIESLIDDVLKPFEDLKNTLTGDWEQLKTDAEEKWGAISESISTKFGEAKTWVEEKAGDIKTNLTGAWETIKTNTEEKWDKVATAVSDALSGAKDTAGDNADTIKTTLETDWGSIKDTAVQKWTEIKDNVIENFGLTKDDVEENSGVFKENMLTNWEEMSANALEKWTTIKTDVTTKMQELKQQTEDNTRTLKANLTQLWQDIKGAAYEKFLGLKNNTVEIFRALANDIKAPLNAFLSSIEAMVNHAISAINKLFDAVNEALELGNDWLKYMGLPSLPKLSHLPSISLPRLAEGAVIPPNREFLAVLGDQSHGTNIEAPLDTIKQAVAEVLATNNSNGEVVELLQELIRVVEDKDLTIGDKEIGKANARYVNKQRLIRGTSF